MKITLRINDKQDIHAVLNLLGPEDVLEIEPGVYPITETFRLDGTRIVPVEKQGSQ